MTVSKTPVNKYDIVSYIPLPVEGDNAPRYFL